MISVLCYGDSNTYGFIPGSGGRYTEEQRYPGRLKKLLGEEYRVIEEGCNGRTALYNEEPERFETGTDYLERCLEKNRPVDLVILMLGSNDLKAWLKQTAEQIAASAGALAERILSFSEKTQGFAPKLILVSPPRIGTEVKNSPFYGEFTEAAVAESEKFRACYQKEAGKRGCIFFDAAECVYPSELDSLHLTPEGHTALAEGLCALVRKTCEPSDC